MEHGNELNWGIWLSDNCLFENPEAIILRKTGRLYYKDSVRDMCTLYEIFLKHNCLKLMVRSDNRNGKGGE